MNPADTKADDGLGVLAQQAKADFFAALGEEIPVSCGGNAPPEDEVARGAPFRLAVALGRCRLFGVDLGEADGVLTVAETVAAATYGVEACKRWCDSAQRLGESFDGAADEAEFDLDAIGLFEARMDCWALAEVFDEADLEAKARGDDRSGIIATCEIFSEEAIAFAAALETEENLRLLYPVLEAGLVEEWKRELAKDPAHPEDPQILPLLLDGSIEAAVERMNGEALATMPDEVAWRKLRGKA